MGDLRIHLGLGGLWAERNVTQRGVMKKHADALLGESHTLTALPGLSGRSANTVTARKMKWVSPAIAVVSLNCAQGAQVGDKCDRYGSLSHGSNCTT